MKMLNMQYDHLGIGEKCCIFSQVVHKHDQKSMELWSVIMGIAATRANPILGNCNKWKYNLWGWCKKHEKEHWRKRQQGSREIQEGFNEAWAAKMAELCFISLSLPQRACWKYHCCAWPVTHCLSCPVASSLSSSHCIIGKPLQLSRRCVSHWGAVHQLCNCSPVVLGAPHVASKAPETVGNIK